MTKKPAASAIKIPLLDLKTQYADIREDLLDAAKRVMDSGVFILGPEGQTFEKEFAKAQNVAYCAGMSSGTQALQAAVELCGIGPGHEVAVPAFTFIATATVVSALGAKPLFVDVDPLSLTLDPNDLARRLNARVKAVIPVHLYGFPADMDPIISLSRSAGLKIVEDCAQAHLTLYRGKSAGGLGDMGAFSFYPSKNLAALGDAGCLTTEDKRLWEEAVVLRNVGRKPGSHYEHARIGHNFRLDELQAAFLRVKLKRLNQWTQARRAIARGYRLALAELPLKLPPEEKEGSRHSYHLFVIQTPQRDDLAKHLADAGIGAGVYYPLPLHLQPAFRHLGHKPGDFPQSERASKEVLALPLYPEMESGQAEHVAQEIRKFFS